MSKSKKNKREKRKVEFSAKEAIKKEEKDSGCQCLD